MSQPQAANPLGTEKEGKLLLKFAVPSVISLVINSLYNMVDQIFIGQGVGYLGNGATNIIAPRMMISIAVSTLVGDGLAAFFSLHLGMGEGGFSFGGFESSQDATSLVNSPIDTPVSMGSVESRPMLSWIFFDESYTETYHQYFSEFIETVFASGAFAEWIAETQALIAPYVEKDPTKFCTTEEFEAGVDALVEFCTLRAESIQGQLEGSIPATQEGQQAEDDALIDASGLDLGAMGSMDMGGMGGGGFGPENGDMAEGMPEDMPETE